MTAHGDAAPPAQIPNEPLLIRTKEHGILDQTTAEVVRGIARSLVIADQSVIHVHGGLVSAANAIKAAIRLDAVYRPTLLPVFPVWESGLLEIARNHEKDIFSEKLFKALLKLLLKWAGGKVLEVPGARAPGDPLPPPLYDHEVRQALENAEAAGINSTVPEPLIDVKPPIQGPPPLTPDEEKEFEEILKQDQDLQDAVDGVVLGLNVPSIQGARSPSPNVVPTPTLISKNIQDELRREGERDGGARGVAAALAIIKHGVIIFARIIKRFYQHRAHGLYTTCVEEICRELYLDAIGEWFWTQMKNDTADTFSPGEANEPRGGSTLVQALAAEVSTAAKTGRPLPKISIVAHSAGSIWTCHFLKALDDSRQSGEMPASFRLHKLIFLAPACTSALFARTLELHAARPLFAEFRMFALDDSLESGYWEAPPLYPRSLLYMVSGMFESTVDEPLLGMQRYLIDTKVFNEADIRAIRTFLATSATQSIFSIAQGADGLSSDALRHGAFTNTAVPEPATMASVLYMLSH
jgi:hypothetical protein